MCVLLSLGVTPAALAAPGDQAVKHAEQLNAAAQELAFFNFDRSYELFAALRQKLPPTEREARQQATLGMALAAHSRTPSSAALINEAAALYRELTDPALVSPFAPRALLQLGRIAEVRDYGGDVIDLPAAIGFYQQVHQTWPEQDIADEAALRHGVALTQQFDDLAKVREGVAFMQTWVASREDRPLASSIYEAIGWAYVKVLQDPKASLPAFLKADAIGLIDVSTIGQQYFMIAEIAEKQAGDIDTAVGYYNKLIRVAPRSGRAFEAQLALRRLSEQYPERNIVVPEIDLMSGTAETDTGVPTQPTPSQETIPPAPQPERLP